MKIEMSLSTAIVLLLLPALLWLGEVGAYVRNAASASVQSLNTVHCATVSQISPEIVRELKDFEDLIPAVTVDEIVAEHMIIDSNFRKAINFLRSSSFTNLLDRAQTIPEVQSILSFLHLLVQPSQPSQSTLKGCIHSQPTESAMDVAEGPEIVLLRQTPFPSHEASAYVYQVRTFTSFVEELLRHLPHDKYVQLINAKRQKSTAFAEFYSALRSAQLLPMVQAAMKTTNVTEIIKVFAANDVDVNGLVPIAFKVISWGPPPA